MGLKVQFVQRASGKEALSIVASSLEEFANLHSVIEALHVCR